MSREERQERKRLEKEAFGRGGNAGRYLLREKLVSIGDDFWIEDGTGAKAFKVDGKALRIRDTLVFEDPDGNEVASIKQKMMRVRKTMEVEGPDGETLATIKKDMITPFRERYTVERADGSELHVQGNILDHEYEFELDGRKVAQVSKKWFRVRDSYGVEFAQDQEVAVILASAVDIDQIAHDIG